MRARHRTRAGRRPGRPAGATSDRTRERVLTAALEAFAQQGRAGTSMRDIARRARLRASTLYHHFSSKEALYYEVQEYVHGRVRSLVVEALGRSHDLRDATREVVGVVFDFFLQHPACLRMGYRGMLEGDRGRGAGGDRVSERWLGLVEATLGPAEARGEVKDIDPVHFMVTVDALVHWHILNDGLYERLLGRGLGDPVVAAGTREHVIRVALRTLGLD